MFIDKETKYFDSVVKNYLSTVLSNYIKKETILLTLPFHSCYLESSLRNDNKRKTFFKELEPHLKKNEIKVFNFNDDIDFLISNGNFHFLLSVNKLILLDYNCNVIYESVDYQLHSKNNDLIRMKINTYLDYCQLEYVSRDSINIYMSGKGKIKKIDVLEKNINVDFENSFYSKIIYDRDFNMISVEINSSMKKKINSKKKKFNVSNISQFFDEIGEYLDIYTLTNDKSIKSSKFDIYQDQINFIKAIVNNKYYTPEAKKKYEEIKKHISSFYDINLYQKEIEYFNNNQLKDSNLIDIIKENYISNDKIYLHTAKSLFLLQKVKSNPECLFNPELIEKYIYLDKYKRNNQKMLSCFSNHNKNKNII